MSKSAGVLYISYDGMTDNLGQSQVIPYLEGLSKKGFSVHILSCEKPAMFEARKEYISDLLRKASIEWHPISYTAKPPLLSTIFDIVRLQRKAKEIIKNKTFNIQLLHCRSYISAHVGWFCMKKYKMPWIFDMRGFWADERVDGNIWKLSNPVFKMVYGYFKRMEKIFVTQASEIICLTQVGANEIRSWQSYKQFSKPITVIPCCADLELFNYENSKGNVNALRKELNISDNSFVISYLGSFGTWYMTGEMFDFFKVVYEKNSKAIFLCITPDNPDSLLNIATNKGIPESSLRIIRANREDVPKYASLSSWSMFFIKQVYSKKASSPTKMGELLSLGVPLVCNSNVGDVETIMNDCPQGFVVKHFTHDEYQKIAEQMFGVLEIDRADIRSVAEKYYSLEKGIELYAKVYQSVLKSL